MPAFGDTYRMVADVTSPIAQIGASNAEIARQRMLRRQQLEDRAFGVERQDLQYQRQLIRDQAERDFRAQESQAGRDAARQNTELYWGNMRERDEANRMAKERDAYLQKNEAAEAAMTKAGVPVALRNPSLTPEQKMELAYQYQGKQATSKFQSIYGGIDSTLTQMKNIYTSMTKEDPNLRSRVFQRLKDDPVVYNALGGKVSQLNKDSYDEFLAKLDDDKRTTIMDAFAQALAVESEASGNRRQMQFAGELFQLNATLKAQQSALQAFTRDNQEFIDWETALPKADIQDPGETVPPPFDEDGLVTDIPEMPLPQTKPADADNSGFRQSSVYVPAGGFPSIPGMFAPKPKVPAKQAEPSQYFKAPPVVIDGPFPSSFNTNIPPAAFTPR